MLKLTNVSTHQSDREMFDNNPEKVIEYLTSLGLDGLEVSQGTQETLRWFPKGKTQGMHMLYWPMWLDFWRGDTEALREQFGDDETWKHYYGGDSQEVLVNTYRQGIALAKQFDVQYMVVHVCHVTLADIYTFQFDYNNQEVLDSYTEFINRVFDGIDCDIPVLFENLWWPGLTFLEEEQAMQFLDSIHYEHKGFMLDIGHMMVTNPKLRDEEEAVAYILEVLRARPRLLENIRGIHLNASLSGAYIEKIYNGTAMKDTKEEYWTRFGRGIQHVQKIDRHLPFESPSIQQVIALVEPEFLVHELLAGDLATLKENLRKQVTACARQIFC